MDIIKAGIYNRKSTDENGRQNQSLETQDTWNKNYAKENNIEVVMVINEAKSAKEPGREEFKKLIDALDKGIINTIIVMHLDRLTRNAIDEGTIKWYAQNKKIIAIHCVEGIFTGEQILVMSIHFGFSNQFIVDLSKKVREGMQTKLNNGGIISKAPLGYKNDKIKKTAEINGDTSVYIPRIFQLRTEGHSLRLIADVLYDEGLRNSNENKVQIATIEKILKNPFYYGVVHRLGELYEGQHEPLISKEVYDKVNAISRGVIYVHDKNITPLKGKVVHSESGTKMTVSLVKKKYTYFHLHSSHSSTGKLWFSQKKIIEHFDNCIDLYIIPEECKEKVKDGIYTEFSNRIDSNRKLRKVLNTHITKKQTSKDGLIKMRRNEELTSEEFIQAKNELINEIEDLNFQIGKIENEDSKDLDSLNKSVELLVELYSKWKTLDDDKKLSIISTIVVELQIDNKKRLTIKENPLFVLFRELNFQEWYTKVYNSLTLKSLYTHFLTNKQEIIKLTQNIQAIMY